MMKRMVLSVLIMAIMMSLFSQEADSLLLVLQNQTMQVDLLKKEIKVLKKKNQSLQSQVSKLKKSHEADLEDAEKKFAASDEVLQKFELKIGELAQALEESEKSSLDSITVLGEWTKKMIMILAIIVIVLFLVLLILIITNRRRIEAAYNKLEAKVDNTKEAVEKEIKGVLKGLEDDIKALKTAVEKGK